MSFAFEDFDGDEAGSVVVGPTYPNGYAYRRALRIAGAVVTGPTALADLPLRFDETLASLKSTANGGNVESASGWDIRFEDTSGAKLRHELETYDPVAGRAAGWLRVPSATPGVDLDLYMYYGKPSLAGPEEDTSTAGTWERCLGCWRAPDGRDVTGHGRHLTTSGVTSGSILGHPASVLASSSYLELLDVTHMNARSQFTAVLLLQPASLPTGNADFLRYGGTASGSGKLGFTHYDQPDIAKALRNYVALGGNTAFVIGPANSAVAAHATTWACVARSGAWPIQYFDGAAATSTQRGGFGTGTTSYGSTDLLRIGAGYGDNTTCVPGAYGRHWVFDSALSADYLAFLDLTVRAPHAVYGLGDEDASTDADRSPVMAPVVASVGASGTVDIDVKSHAADPDGQSMAAGTASPAAALGSTSLVAGLVRYVAGAVQGLDRFGATVTAGAKTARALVSVTVGTGGPPVGGGNLPVAPDYTGYWKPYRKASGNSVITQHTGDVELKGGTVADGQQAIALVSVDRPDHASQGMFNPPYTLEYVYTPTDNNSDSGGVFAQLFLLRRTGAGNANLGSLAADLSPTDAGWGAAGTTGIRFSFDTKNPSASLANKIRGRANDTSFGPSNNYASPANFALTPGETAQDFVFPRNQASHLAWSFPGDDTIAVTATIPGVGDVSQSWKDPLISTYLNTAATNIVLMSYAGRDALFANVVWTDGGRPPGGGTGAEGAAPDFPDVADLIQNQGWHYENVTGNGGGGIPGNARSLQAAFNSLTPSQIASGVLLLVNYGTSETVTGGLTLSKSGTAAKPIIIRVGGWHSDTNTFVEPDKTSGGTGFFPSSNALRATIAWTGGCNISGDHVWVRGLRFQGGGNITGDGNRFNRCLFDAANGSCNDIGVGSIWDWCEWSQVMGGHLDVQPSGGARNTWVYRCHFHDNGNAHPSANDGGGVFFGNGAPDQFHKSGALQGTQYDANLVAQDCMFENWSWYANSLEVKCNGAKLLRCSQKKGTGDHAPRMLMRHGDRGLWAACHFGDGDFCCRGIGTVVADCTATGNNQRGPAGGNITSTAWEAYVAAHISPTDPGKPATNYGTGENIVFAGCDFAIMLGFDPTVAGTSLPPTGTIVESDCTGGVNKATYCSPAPTYTTRARSVARYVETATSLVKAPRMWTGGTGANADVGTNGRYSTAQ